MKMRGWTLYFEQYQQKRRFDAICELLPTGQVDSFKPNRQRFEEKSDTGMLEVAGADGVDKTTTTDNCKT